MENWQWICFGLGLVSYFGGMVMMMRRAEKNLSQSERDAEAKGYFVKRNKKDLDR